MKIGRFFLAGLVFISAGSAGISQVTTYTWVPAGAGTDNSFGNAANWQGAAVPPTDGSARLVLPHAAGEELRLGSGNVAIDSLALTQTYHTFGYAIRSDGSTTLALAHGITSTNNGYSASLLFDSAVSINLTADQTWSVQYVTINGAIGGAGHLSFSPNSYYSSSYYNRGYLTLNGPGNFTGGFSAYNTSIYLGQASALAGGPISLNDVSLTLDNASYTFADALNLSGSVDFQSVGYDHPGVFHLDGPISLQGGASLASYHSEGKPVYLSGTIADSGGPSTLSIHSGLFVIDGDNSTGGYTGGTYADDGGAIIFSHGSSVPTAGLISASSRGYVGGAFTANFQSKLIDRLDGDNFYGTLGLDSDPAGPVLNFTEAIDLSGLYNYRGLGSLTRAILSGAITLGEGQDYRFGGGGGVLTVSSDLTDACAGLYLNTPAYSSPLTLILQGNNTFAGLIENDKGILIFDGPAALPAGSILRFAEGYNPAYIGYTENYVTTPNAFLGRISGLSEFSVVGIDSANPASPRTITDAIDLSLGGNRTGSYYLGTATAVTLAGNITAPATDGAGALSLTGVNGGHLTVNSTIASPTTALVIGFEHPLAERPGTVQLNAANTFTGGTTLYSGTLLLGNAAALGSGPLTIEGDSSDGQTLATTSGMTIANAIVINTDFTVGLPDVTTNLTLSGSISGPQELAYVGAGTLTLSGRNSFRELAVEATGAGGVVLAGNHALRNVWLNTGSLTVGASSSFQSLEGETDTQLVLNPGTNLLLYSAGIGEGPIQHTMQGVISGTGSLTLGYGDGLHLTAANTFSGGLTILDGSLKLDQATSLGTGPLTIAGGFYNDDSESYAEAGLIAGAPGLTFANPVNLQGWLTLGAYYYYYGDTHEDFGLSGVISGQGGLDKESPNTVTLSGNNTFSGGLFISEGTVVLAHDHAAGTGILGFGSDGGTAVFTTAAPEIGGLESENDDATVQLATGSTLRINQLDNLAYAGSISGTDARLVKAGPGRLVLEGTNTNTGGARVDGGSLVFAGTGALDAFTGTGANAVTVGAGGYAGLGTTEISTAAFLAKFDRAATVGSLGFDSTYGEENFFGDPVDLTGFASSVRLGSASEATLEASALITPAGNDYQFGGGGGRLTVASPLTGARGLNATSSALQPLTLLLANDNYFSGGVHAENSAVVFAPFSADYVTNFTLGPGGYIGSADPSLSVPSFLSRFATSTSQGIIGFDSLDGDQPRVIGTTLNLGAFAPGGSLYVGTASSLVLRGNIVLPSGSTSYRFAAYKGGDLTVLSPLTGANSVVIGDPNSLGAFGDPLNDELSQVTLRGNNSYTGGTTLYTGALYVDNGAALGSGALTIQPHNLDFPGKEDAMPVFGSSRMGNVIATSLILNSGLELGTDGEDFTLTGGISGSGALRLSDEDLTVRLNGAGTFTGGTFLEDGLLLAGSDSALGTGTIHFQGGALGAAGGAHSLANALVAESGSLRFGGTAKLALNGNLALDGYTEVTRYNYQGAPALTFNGVISGNGQLSLDTQNAVLLNGANTYTGGTRVGSRTQVIFSSLAAMPDTGLLHLDGYGSYIGLATAPANLQDYLSRFAPGAYGTIGFDSPLAGPTQTFTGDIDLSRFYSVGLGSATSAILTGTITPYSSGYQLGGGGGTLTVQSNLVDGGGNRSLYVVSNDNLPSVVRLTGTNTYTGGTTVSYAALIFGSAGAIPASGVISLTGNNDYAGSDTADVSFGDFLTHFRGDLWTGIIGIDSPNPNSPRTVTAPDLSVFSESYTPNIALGTATAAIIDGTITLKGDQTDYRFAAWGNGRLTVNSILSGSRGLRLNAVADNRGLSAYDPTIILNAANTFSGGTQLDGGRLVLGHTAALGTGPLIVYHSGNSPESILQSSVPGGTIANNIQLDSRLRVDGTADTTLAGVISGYANDLIKSGSFALTLSNDNTFNYAQIRLLQGVINFNHDGSAGDYNPLLFEGDGGTANFTTSAPQLGGLAAAYGASATINLSAGTALTLNNPDTELAFPGVIAGSGSLVKSGDYTQFLGGANTYTGGTTVNQGVLVANNNSALGTGAVTLNGGQLAFGKGITLANPISFGANGGTLAGTGTINGPVVLGSNAGLSPGASPGTLTFGSSLTLGGGAFLDFEIQDPAGLPGVGYDTLQVGGTLLISATPASPYTIHLISLDGNGANGPLVLSDSQAQYSLLLATAGTLSGFDASSFVLDTSRFSSTLGTSATFALSASGNELRLNFSPIPEPSTYLLMLSGGALLWLGARRRRA